jgi:signal transduction histidine kinase
MEELRDINTMLQLMPQPAFRVENGTISHVNHAAAAYLLAPGQAFADLIHTGRQEYEEFTSGSLYLTLLLAQQQVGATLCRMEHGDIVTLQQPMDMPQLKVLALAARELREPLNGILSLTEQMLPGMAPENTTQQLQLAQLNRRLYQLLRITGNMSDAGAYAQGFAGRMEAIEICSFLQELLEKASAFGSFNGVSLAYELPRDTIFTMVDKEKLERAVYNLLSNALKFADANTIVRAKLVCKNKRLYFSVSNTCSTPGPQGNIYQQFLREPALEDPRNGLGLGMVLVRSAATIHGGAVLAEQTEDGNRFTMTLQLSPTATDQLHSPILGFDYAGERDHCLLELADVLPPQLYSTEQIF